MTKLRKADEFTELKKAVIDALASQIDNKNKKELAKEFGLTEEQLDVLVRKLLDAWLSNPDYIVFIASMLGLSMPRKDEKSEKKSRHYIG